MFLNEKVLKIGWMIPVEVEIWPVPANFFQRDDVNVLARFNDIFVSEIVENLFYSSHIYIAKQNIHF